MYLYGAFTLEDLLPINWKPQDYIICEARLESDPNVIMIAYKSEEGPIWTRPSNVFFELVQHEGNAVPRFAPIS